MNNAIRTIALIAHDNRKPVLAEWVQTNQKQLSNLNLISTGTTGQLIADKTGLAVTCLKSGPHGGDQQIGARIAEGEVDMLIFFWDPLEPMSHDPDIRALLRLATLWNIPIASNQSTADFLVSSPCFQAYERQVPGWGNGN